jgi:hypothetical protein
MGLAVGRALADGSGITTIAAVDGGGAAEATGAGVTMGGATGGGGATVSGTRDAPPAAGAGWVIFHTPAPPIPRTTTVPTMNIVADDLRSGALDRLASFVSRAAPRSVCLPAIGEACVCGVPPAAPYWVAATASSGVTALDAAGGGGADGRTGVA